MKMRFMPSRLTGRPRHLADGAITVLTVDKAVAALKGLAVRGVADILVNNVGIYGPQDFFDIPDAK